MDPAGLIGLATASHIVFFEYCECYVPMQRENDLSILPGGRVARQQSKKITTVRPEHRPAESMD